MTGRSVALASPDRESIVRRYVPSERCDYCLYVDDCRVRGRIEGNGKEKCARFRWGYTVHDFEIAGVEIFEAVDAYGIALGGLIQHGWEVIRPDVRWEDGREIENPTQWVEWCSALWSKEGRRASVSTLKKAWSILGVEVPDDMSSTLAYEVKSGLKKGETLQKALATVSHHGYSAYHVRILKGLRNRGLVEGWTLPTLSIEDGRLIVRSGKRRLVAATVESNGNGGDPLLLAALYMLSKGISVDMEEKEK